MGKKWFNGWSDPSKKEKSAPPSRAVKDALARGVGPQQPMRTTPLDYSWLHEDPAINTKLIEEYYKKEMRTKASASGTLSGAYLTPLTTGAITVGPIITGTATSVTGWYGDEVTEADEPEPPNKSVDELTKEVFGGPRAGGNKKIYEFNTELGF